MSVLQYAGIHYCRNCKLQIDFFLQETYSWFSILFIPIKYNYELLLVCDNCLLPKTRLDKKQKTEIIKTMKTIVPSQELTHMFINDFTNRVYTKFDEQQEEMNEEQKEMFDKQMIQLIDDMKFKYQDKCSEKQLDYLVGVSWSILTNEED